MTFSSVAQSCPTLCNPTDCSTPGFTVNHQFPEIAQTHPLSRWCHPTISSSVVPFSCLQSFPASGSFPMSQFFTSGGQSVGASAGACLSNEYSEQTSHRIDWLDLFSVQGILKSSPNHSSKASILQQSAFFYSPTILSTRRTIALTRWIFVGRVMFLLFNMLSRLVIAFLPRSKRLLISWLQSPSAVVLEPPKIKNKVCH